MSWRGLAVAAVVVATPLAAIGCTHSVTGAAQRAVHGDGESGHGYGFSQDRCGLLLDATVQQVLGADHVVRPYSGAVCQYVLLRHSTVIDSTFSWFDTGSLERERALAEQTKAAVSDITVQRHRGFLARRSVTGDGCSATAATNPGVASWWVQIRGNASGDPCGDAQKLLSETLSSDL
ncbi:MAG: hypothetical protein QOE41_3688 [Mycobacterium sp.]|jgi:hypothetical protein|nr:hypothetical protein [Mycobacterium sp.]MDT5134377.1 hypothetical protein [Mycobacterium sp.]